MPRAQRRRARHRCDQSVLIGQLRASLRGTQWWAWHKAHESRPDLIHDLHGEEKTRPALELNQDLVRKIHQGIYEWGSRAGAARLLRFDERTLRAWNKKGREGAGGIYAELWQSVQNAEQKRDADRAARAARPPAKPEIVAATMHNPNGGGRISCALTVDELEALKSLCDMTISRGLNGQVEVYRPRRGAALTRSQQELIDLMLDVTLKNKLGDLEKLEFRPAQE